MREIALLAVLLLPSWGFLGDMRKNAEDYLLPKATVIVNEKVPASVVTAPTKNTLESVKSDARATYSIDLATGTELSSGNPDEKLQVASLTKLMTAYVVLKDSPNLEEMVTVPNYSLQIGDAVAGIVAGEKLSKKDVLAAMLINSGSDAAQALAILDSGTTEGFVTKMNEAATRLGLANTHFANPVGWDAESNYSSARDLTNLTRILLGNEFFRQTVSTKSKDIITQGGRTISLASTNQLLGTGGYSGVKTGYTYGALECLVSLEKSASHEILTVVLGSSDRFGETSSINTWTNSHFLW